MSVISNHAGNDQWVKTIGQIDEDTQIVCIETAKRKINQLLEKPKHIFSHQSRDGKCFWGGAIRVSGYIISISCLPEPGDTAIILATLTDIECIDKKTAELCAIFTNCEKHLQPLL